MDEHPELRGKVHLAVTEWLFNSKGYGERNFTDESPSWMNEGGAVMAAGFLNTVLRHTAEIKITDMTGIMEFAGIWKRREQVYRRSGVLRFQNVHSGEGRHRAAGELPTRERYNVDGRSAAARRREGHSYIDVVATRSADGRKVTLLCVNRSLSQDVPANFDLGKLHATAAAEVEQISAANRYERNDEVEPLHVVPVPGSIAKPDAGPLPSHCLTKA